MNISAAIARPWVKALVTTGELISSPFSDGVSFLIFSCQASLSVGIPKEGEKIEAVWVTSDEEGRFVFAQMVPAAEYETLYLGAAVQGAFGGATFDDITIEPSMVLGLGEVTFIPTADISIFYP